MMELKVIGYGELKDNNICEANAVDKNGNEYIIRWDYKKIKVPYDFTRSENIIEVMTIEGEPIKEPVHVEMNVKVHYINIDADRDTEKEGYPEPWEGDDFVCSTDYDMEQWLIDHNLTFDQDDNDPTEYWITDEYWDTEKNRISERTGERYLLWGMVPTSDEWYD